LGPRTHSPAACNPCLANEIDPDGPFSRVRGIVLALVAVFKGEAYMLWILAVVMGGLGFGYVTVRRRRKAEQKPAGAR
jgi:hypothetical protein